MPFDRQYALRINKASGFAELDWSANLPLTHYEHVATVCLAPTAPDRPDSPNYSVYLEARRRMQQINNALLNELEQNHRRAGHLPVVCEFHHACYGRCFALVVGGQVTRAEPAVFPQRGLSALEQAVYEQKTISELSQAGRVLAGRVLHDRSGHWLAPASAAEN